MRELALEKTRLDGRYDVLSLLGRGSYAEIYVARDNRAAPESLHQLVVIKALNVFLQEEPDTDLERTLIENFQNEAVALDRVRHPSIISRLGHGTARDLRGVVFHYIVLEYLPGGDLMQMCRRAPLTLEKTLGYLEQVCAGLSHAHSQGVIHRDIKPQNLLLTEDKKTVMIADFGVARFTNHDAPITRVGTNIYAAPEHSPLNVVQEIAEGKDVRLTPAADVYSLAKTVYALLTGESPRRFANAPLTNFPPSLAAQNWASEVLRVLEHATQRNLENRTRTVTEFWEEICHAGRETEEAATCVFNRTAAQTWAASVAGFVSEPVPAKPEFSSMPNVQVATDSLSQLPHRPRVVVEVGGKQPLPTAPETIFKNVVPADNGKQRQVAPPQSNDIQPPPVQTAPARPSWLATFLQRIALRFAVVLLILGVFIGVLGGTYNYLQNLGYLPIRIFGTNERNGVINATVADNASAANIRADASATSKDLGDVPNGSRVKILNERGNWYEVQIIERSSPKINPNEADRGWINKKLIEIQ